MSKKPAVPPEKAAEKVEEKSLPATGGQTDQTPEKAIEQLVVKVDEVLLPVISDQPVMPPVIAVEKIEEQSLPATSAHLVGSCPILLDGVLYQPYDEIFLTEAQAVRLGRKVAFLPAAHDQINPWAWSNRAS